MEKPRNVDTFLYREVSTFLDIRPFMEKPRNVDTLLYREVSTFLDIRQFEGFPSKMWKPPYIVNYPHFWAFP